MTSVVGLIVIKWWLRLKLPGLIYFTSKVLHTWYIRPNHPACVYLWVWAPRVFSRSSSLEECSASLARVSCREFTAHSFVGCCASFVLFIYFFCSMCIRVICVPVWMCACCSVYAQVEAQLAGISSLSSVSLRDQTQAVRLGSKRPYLSIRTSTCFYYQT